MKKPSYLIGTMHVSSKIAFNLPDSFYYAIRNAQVVALESNPETWQEDMNKYDFSDQGYYRKPSALSSYLAMPNDYLNIKTLKFYKYESKIERALYSNPSTINNLLYRSYGNDASDFEEDTYLDMYIFQCGKKWGKKVTGVEDYGESMKLMAEAYQDAAKDKNRKVRSYGDIDEAYSMDRLQEAYRTGNLDLLDSINKFNSVSEAFDEKFLYKRNEIQANSIDSILRSGSSLFVGVGAAHLPGERGVIEMLRAMGYKLRPVKMGERASREKDLVDKLRVPVVFRTETADDGAFKVDVPGKLYKFGEDNALDQRQYADMSNGSYYMVTRIMTNAWMWNHKTDEVLRKVDSLLYENIPGKIISRIPVTKNGYKGLDIVNRTRRGDIQRYTIFVTPFEILFFKMSGNGDYVKNGPEADKFFGSIQLKEYKEQATAWKKFSPAWGGFAVDFPHDPYVGNDGSWIFDAGDKTTGTHYRLVRSDIHNYNFVEEDTFDLSLMEESFSASDFIDTILTRKQTTYKGYPALDCKYRDKQGGIYMTRFIIKGPHYYTLVAHGRQETATMGAFLNSFTIAPYVYREPKREKDTSLYFSVTTPVFPEDKKIKLDIPAYNYLTVNDEEESEEDIMGGGAFRSKTISNDSTGEKIFVSFMRWPQYTYLKDSSDFEYGSMGKDSSWLVRYKKKATLPGDIQLFEMIVSDTGSSRALWGKTYYKNGIGFSLTTQIDTLAKPSSFLENFFSSFQPVDTLKGLDPFQKKSALFFNDLASHDSVVRKRALKNMSEIDLDSTDLPALRKVIAGLNWNEKKYLDTKKSFINKLGNIRTRQSADYLRQLYYAFGDTVQLQYSVLENLLQQQTAYAYSIFSDIITAEPPVLYLDNTGYSNYKYPNDYEPSSWYNYDDGEFLDELTDSLKLTRSILPALLPLLNLEDYKMQIMELLGQMVDSSLVTSKDYDQFFSKFLLEAKQELKKQSIAEMNKALEKAEEDKITHKPQYPLYKYEENDKGNDNLSLYATLLLPYWDTNPAVQGVFAQMLSSNDKLLKYNTFLLLIRNKKSYPDSLFRYFGSLDDYRYSLYSDLKTMGQLDKFPKLYNNHLDLGRSVLLKMQTYSKPDSLVYLERLRTDYQGKQGYIYFFRYKTKKDDMGWKIASVGLVPLDAKSFEFDDSPELGSGLYSYSPFRYGRYAFTSFSDNRITDGETLMMQLKKMQKRLLYSKRKSAKNFYEEDANRTSLASLYED